MSRSKAQQRNRSRNNEIFEAHARKSGLKSALVNCDLRGVKQGAYNSAHKAWKAKGLTAYANQPVAFRTSYENEINSRMGGVCRSRQTFRKMAKPLVHVRTITRIERRYKYARKHYRKVLKDTGWTGNRVDSEFAKHFPSEWRLLQTDDKR